MTGVLSERETVRLVISKETARLDIISTNKISDRTILRSLDRISYYKNSVQYRDKSPWASMK